MRQQLYLIAVVLLFSAACTKNPFSSFDKDNPIKIGEYLTLTGSESGLGQETHKGILMAIEEQNKEGGLHNRPLKLLTFDTKASEERTAKGVKMLVEEQKVVALLGEVASSRSLAAAKIAQAANIPMITPSSTHPEVTKVGDFIFRVCFIDPFQGFVMAKFAYKNLKLTKVAVIKDLKSTYSKGLADHFVASFRNFGGEIVADEVYNAGDIDFKSQLTFIRSVKPEAIFVPGYYKEVALIARQARSLGIKSHFLGGDGWDSKRLFEIGKDAIHGSYFSNHYTPALQETPAIQFRKKFRKRFNENPSGLAAMGYDAANILIRAIKSSKALDPDAIRKNINSVKNYPGVTGSITINNNRNADKPAFVVRVDGPVNRYVTTIKPELNWQEKANPKAPQTEETADKPSGQSSAEKETAPSNEEAE